MSPIADTLICLRFFSRLPVPSTKREAALGAAGLARAAAMVPVGAAIIALVPVAALILATAARLDPWIAALLTIGATIVTTGALHEDGLADCADSFGARDREKRLAIMRDSRIGTFGALALIFSVSLRTAALASLLPRSVPGAATAIVLAAILSRVACLIALQLPPARRDGLGAGVGAPSRAATATAVGITVFAVFASMLVIGVACALGALLVATALAGLTLWGAWCRFGGQTGDVAGAVQQIVEVAMLVSIAAMIR